MESGLLYTFSTIAQALGGMFALLAAFVLYRFQSLQILMHADATLLDDAWQGQRIEQDRHHELRGHGRFRELWENIRAQVEALPKEVRYPYGSHGRVPFDRLRRTLELQEALSRKFVISACLTGVTLMGSVALIPLAQTIRSHQLLAITCLVIGVLMFAACIASYWIVITAALGFRRVGKRKSTP